MARAATRVGSTAETLKQAIDRHAPVDAKSDWGLPGVLAHTAYHLGAIQVKTDALPGDR